MVVFSSYAATSNTKLKQDFVVDSHSNRLTNAFVRIRFLAINFGQLVWTHNNSCTCNHVVGVPTVERIKDVNEFAVHLIGHVDFVSFCCRNPC